MFGSDFPNQVGPGVDAILQMEFLSAEQKADILCNNAARFLRLSTHPWERSPETAGATSARS